MVLESEGLLIASIVNLLASQDGYDVSSKRFNALKSLDQLNGHQPDVIILDVTQLPAHIAALMELVDRNPKMRLIVVRLDDNRLHIFDKHVVQVEQVSDFLEQL